MGARSARLDTSEERDHACCSGPLPRGALGDVDQEVLHSEAVPKDKEGKEEPKGEEKLASR